MLWAWFRRPRQQPGGHQGRHGEHPQLNRLGDQFGLHQAAADPGARQGRHPQDQRRPQGHLAAADVGPHIGQGQQGHHQERERNGLAGGQARSAHQQGHEQDRATGPQHGQQNSDQDPATEQQHRRAKAEADDHACTRFQGMTASRRAMPQKPLTPAKVRPAPTKPASQIQPGARVWLRITPSSTRLPAAICT